MGTPKNILIVGGGLAGTFMAFESLFAGHQVTLLDQPQENSPSRVAAGLYNIVTGRIASKTWQAEVFLEALEGFFARPEIEPLRRFLHPLPLYRPYKSISERNEWYIKSHAPEFAPLIRHQGSPVDSEKYHNDLGGMEILPCGWLDTIGFLEASKATLALQSNFKFYELGFDSNLLDPVKLTYPFPGGREQFDEVVFCEGPMLKNNPWFGNIDLRPLKGQVIEIEAPDLPEDRIFLRKVFFVPLGEGRFVVGSTYEKNFSTPNPTSEGIRSLLEYVDAAIKVPHRFLEARAGIRPTTPNRRPIVGRHPEFPGLLVFNGMGAKGVLQGPWCANHFRRWLDGQHDTLLSDIALSRFQEI